MPLPPVLSRSRIRAALALVLLGFTACIQGARMPAVSPRSTLAIGEGPGAGGRNAPFQVVFAAPKGKASSVSELSVVFSRPLRALSVAGDEAPPPVRIEPPIAGRWQWVGTNAIQFVPAGGRLPGATRIAVEISGDARSLDGATLGKPYRFDFVTPRPKLVRSSPSSGQTGLEPDAFFDLRFNQPVEPKELERVASFESISGDKRARIPFSVGRPDAKAPRRVELRPAHRLPVHTRFELTIAKDLHSTEGPLDAGEIERVSFSTYGPLEVQGVDCSRDTPHRKCAPGYLSLALSNPVKMKDLKRAVSIDPPVKLAWDSWRDADDETSSADLVAAFKPGRSYTLRIAGDLVDRHGQKLGKTYVQHVDFDDLWPAVEVGISGDTLEPRTSQPIPIGSVNTPSYELGVSALAPEDVLRFVEIDSLDERFQFLLSRHAPRVVHPGAPVNRMGTERVDPGTVLRASGGRGAVGIGVRYKDGQSDVPRTLARIVSVTDLGISAKLSTHGSRVWVTRLSTGSPVAGASVAIRDTAGSTPVYKTDKNGLATVPESDFVPDFDGRTRGTIVVRDGDDWSFRQVADYISPWRYDVPADLSGGTPEYGMMFTERGIYRPGDMVRVKAVLRRAIPTGNEVPVGQALGVALRSPKGEEITTRNVTTSRFGTFSLDFKLPRSAALGDWQLITKGLPRGGYLGKSFTVAEYRPVEFKVGVESDHPAYVRGDAASWTIHGDYLFGAPMAGAAVRYTVTRGRTWFSPPDSDAFVTDASALYADLDEAAQGGGQLLEKRTKLDKLGKVELGAKLDLPGQRGPEMVNVDAEVTDISRQSVGGGTTAIVHPAEFYVGIKTPDDYFVDAPGTLHTDIVALSPEGKHLGGKRVKVDVVSRRWTLARQETGGARTHVVSHVVDTVAGSCDATTEAGRVVGCDVPLKEGGYYVVHATAKDARGNTAESATGIYGIGKGESIWRDSDKLSIDLALDKKEYKIGDTARVLVKSPFPVADALVTVERAGVYRQQRVTLSGPTPTVSVPVTADLGPNAFVGVHLLRGRTHAPPARGSDRPDVGAPAYRVGYAQIRIDPSSHRLAVAVRPAKKDLRPGEQLGVDIAVKDAKGKPASAEVTLYAVDEGVLSLVGYQTPDPVPVFTAARPLEVATLESRESLAKVSLEDLASALGAQKGAEGGGGGSDESGARRDFRQSAYFNPAVMTDASGKAHVAFKLPESLTTFRVMAVAVTGDDKYGFGEDRVTTSQKLMARPALPRFVRAGDRLDAGIVLSAKHFGPAKVQVTANVQGLEIQGDAKKSVDLAKDASVEVRFPMIARTSGTARLRFDAVAEGARDAVEVTRKVETPTSFETVALYGSTKASAGEKIGDLSKIRRDVGKLDVTVSSTALVGLEGGVEQLVEYPYGCTEQLSSRLLPLLPLRALARDFSIPLPKDLDGVVAKTVAEIIKHQRGDGGFGMWVDSRESFPWVSAYALWALDTAKKHGASVPDDVMTRGAAYLRRFLAEMPDDDLYYPSAAFVVDVLASMGQPDPGYMTLLYQSRDKLPLFARALLLHAMAISKQDPSGIKALDADIQNHLRLDANTAAVAENEGDEYAVLMDSPARTTALVLRALLAENPQHPLGAKLARGLLAARHGGTWRSTQESAYALLALDEYRHAQEKVAPDYVAKVWLAGTELFSATLKGRSTLAQDASIPTAKLGGEGGLLVFDKQGQGTLFYEARLKYARRTLPATPLDRGFYVQKTLRAVTPEELPKLLSTVPGAGTTHLSGGDLVLADLVVVTPSPREYVVIEDPLPAGLEAIDANLKTSAAWLDVPGTGGEVGAVDCVGCDDDQDDRIANGTAFLPSWFHQELRDDRVLFFVDHMAAGMYHYRYLARATTFGSFIVPPTKAEEMYSPEVFGRTGAVTVEVK